MPGQKITDLDVIAGPDKQVKVGGTVYRLPADCPIPLYLKIKNYAGEELSDEEAVEDIYASLLELFRIRQPELEVLPIGITALVEAIPRIYGGMEENGDRPTRAAASKAGTRSTKRPKRASRGTS